MVGVHVHSQAFGAKSSCVRHIDLKSIYIAVAVLNVLPNAMMADIIPYDTVTTGVNQEGIFGAARGIIQNSVFTLLLFAALIVLLNIFFPCSTYGSSAAKGSDCFVETFVVDRSTCRIAAVVCSMVSIDTYMPSGFNGIDVGAEEQKFPTIFFLLGLNHGTHLFNAVVTACIFHPVRCDNKHCVLRNILGSGIFVDVCNVMNSTTDGIN